MTNTKKRRKRRKRKKRKKIVKKLICIYNLFLLHIYTTTMGKSYRKSNCIGIAASFDSTHNRVWPRREKRAWHHRVRKCNDSTDWEHNDKALVYTNVYKCQLLTMMYPSGTTGTMRTQPILRNDINFAKEDIEKMVHETNGVDLLDKPHWNNDGNLEDHIRSYLKYLQPGKPEFNTNKRSRLNSSLKQIERRGKLGAFRGIDRSYVECKEIIPDSDKDIYDDVLS